MKSSRQKPAAALLAVLILLLVHAPGATAQSPPGWGWVNQIGTYDPSFQNQNSVGGLGRDAAGSLYLLGSYVGNPLFGGVAAPNLGGTDIFLAKYDPAGVLLWLRTLPSTGFDRGTGLVVEPSGRCTLSGTYGGDSGGNLSLAGFNAAAAPLAGAALLGLAAPGGRYQPLTFVAAVDASGALLWANTPSPVYGGVNVTALHRDGAGNCYVSANTNPQGQLTVNGQSYPPIGSYDAVLLKYTVAGQVAWARRVGVAGMVSGSAYSGEIQTDNADAVYWLVGHNGTMTIDQTTVGVATSTGANSLVKLSAGNRVKWIKNNLLSVGGANAVSQLLAFDALSNALYLSGFSTGGAIVYPGGANPVPVTANAVTSCVARCDTAGQIQWVKPVFYATNVPGGLPGPRGSTIRSFKAQGTGFTLLTRTVDFNATTFYGSARTYGLAEAGLACLAHFNTTANQPDWVRIGGAPSALGQDTGTEPIGAVVDAAGNVFVAGTFAGTAQFGATTIRSSVSVQPEIFLAQLDQAIVTATRPATAGLAWSVYPNPAPGAARLTGLPAAAHVRVYDALGRLVRELPPVPTADAPRALGGLDPGLYLLQVTHTVAPYRSQRLLVQ